MKLFDSLSNTLKKVNQGIPKATEMPLFELQTLQGSKIDWNKFKGKYLLFVNVASECGFTPQYKSLQKLYDTYNEKLEIIGFPCNQFGAQEPGSADEIASFCELNFGVSFTLTEKISVKGVHQHPLYKWLTDANENGIKSSSVKWNFQKYLVDPDRKLIDYYYSTTDPLSKKITRHFE
jgi:glutathione peroxidase